jgi:excisionase family DNA binding protein
MASRGGRLPVHQRRYESIQSVADRLDVNPKTIRRMIARGDLTGYRLGGKVLRVDQAEVDAAMVPIPTAVNGA